MPLYSYIIQLVSLLSIAYLASSFWLPETQILLWTTALLILLNYSLSLSNLFRQGSITVNLIILNVIQLALCLHLMIHKMLGNAHYAYTEPPRWYDWIELVAMHVLRAVDLLDIYDDRYAGKGPNEVISFLHPFLVNRKIQTPNIRIHADNCTEQNKNKYVLWYITWLVTTGRLKHIELKFMIKGHTHSIVDGGIGQMKKELRRSDVFCLEHWSHVINQSASINRACVVNGDNVYDWKNGLCPYFKPFKDIRQFQDLK